MNIQYSRRTLYFSTFRLFLIIIFSNVVLNERDDIDVIWLLVGNKKDVNAERMRVIRSRVGEKTLQKARALPTIQEMRIYRLFTTTITALLRRK